MPGGALCARHFVEVPLDHFGDPGGPRIRVFFREMLLAAHLERRRALPVLLYLPDGPGLPSPRQCSSNDGWLGVALQRYRVLLPDPRGTGRSTRVTARALAQMSPEGQARHVAHFRADSIAQDCEAIRRHLGVGKLSVLGEAFGGHCALTYLSQHPGSLGAVCVAGGLPLLPAGPDEAHRRAYQRAIARCHRYYARYPGDVAKVREVAAHLQGRGGVPLPAGGVLTARRFLSLGALLAGGFGPERMHHLVEHAFVETRSGRELDLRFLAQVEAAQVYDESPLCWLLHEAALCDGPQAGPSRWSAQRLAEEAAFRRAFDYRAALRDRAGPPLRFTGRMVYPWFAKDFVALGDLAAAADLLAAKADWPRLYDLAVLSGTRVPVSVVVDIEDMDLDLEHTRSAAAVLGDRCRLWGSHAFHGFGLTVSVAATLFQMASAEEWSSYAELIEKPWQSDPGQPMTTEQLASLAREEAHDSLYPAANWEEAYREMCRRMQGGAEEAVVKGGALSEGRHLEVPLDHKGAPGGPRISVFYREVLLAERRASRAELPVLLVLGEGPGSPAFRPSQATDGWLSRALEDHRVVLLDQRGSGRSAPVTAQTLDRRGAEEQAAYLAHFRVDSVVEDCEALRRSLGVAQVSLLCESFGGLCALAYLSRHPASLRAVYVTGFPQLLALDPAVPLGERATSEGQAGVATRQDVDDYPSCAPPSLRAEAPHAQDLCRAAESPHPCRAQDPRQRVAAGQDCARAETAAEDADGGAAERARGQRLAEPTGLRARMERVRSLASQRAEARSARYYARYPGDVARVREIVDHLDAQGPAPLPGGGQLRARRFLALGHLLDQAYGAEAMHLLVEDAFDGAGAAQELSLAFLRQVEASQSFDAQPLHWLFGEPLYGGGSHREEALRAEAPEAAGADGAPARALRFSDGPSYAAVAEDSATLAGFARVAELLAAKSDWPSLYDVEALRNTTVPVAVHVDEEDGPLGREVAEGVAALLGARCGLWVSRGCRHGLGCGGASALGRLIELAQQRCEPDAAEDAAPGAPLWAG